MNKFLLLALLFMFTLGAAAQKKAAITGKVINEQGESLKQITVRLAGTQIGAITDQDGRYTISGLQIGNYTLLISSIGYEQQDIPIILSAGSTQMPDVVLKIQTTETEEVVIVGESEGRLLEQSAKAVQAIELGEIKLKAVDMGEIMAQTEGVSVQRAGGLGANTRFALNGLSGDQVRFFYNGIPLDFSPYAFGIANVPVNMIDRVEVYKGVVPIEFGADALGGAVNLVSSKVRHGISGGASYQLGSFNTHRITTNITYADDSLGWFLRAGGFYDLTDNDYKIDVAVPDERGQLQPGTVRRFHDGYRAYGMNLKIGVRGKKWADELSIESYYGDYNNEIQNSQSPGLIDQPSLGIEEAVAGRPFGELRFTSFSRGLNARFRLTPGDRWEIDLHAGYNENERVAIDTSRNLYNWFGEVIRIQNQPGEFGQENHLITSSSSLFLRQQLSYAFAEHHNLRLSVAPTYSHRTGDDLLVEGKFDPALDEGKLFDLVVGLEHTTDLLDERLQMITFTKNYHQSIRVESLDPGLEATLVDKRSVNNFGAGTGVRFKWSDRFSTKLSYEYAFRLPRQDEIFGNGQLILENLSLRPESSHNANLQLGFRSKTTAAKEWQVQGNIFLRQIDDLIFLLVNQEELGSFQNIWSATSAGIEISGRWIDLIPGLTLSANTTYQSYLNTSDEGPFTSFKGDRIPNTPYFFANGAAEYRLDKFLHKQDRLLVSWNTRYVQRFFVGWESAGLQEFKAQIPAQVIHSGGITYQMIINEIRLAFTLEMQNLTDAKVFDFFGVQRPGRAFFLKASFEF